MGKEREGKSVRVLFFVFFVVFFCGGEDEERKMEVVERKSCS